MKEQKREKSGKRRAATAAFLALAALAALVLAAVLGISAYVKHAGGERILGSAEAADTGADCILVLGAAIWDGEPCPMLEDRLDCAVALYFAGASHKLLMSGDGTDGETDVMRDYAVAAGVPSDDILLDPAGYSTYDSVLRARDVYGAASVIVVTQKYHLYRALYIAKQLGLNAWGVASDPRSYAGQVFRDLREILARDKDFVKCMWPAGTAPTGGSAAQDAE